MERSDLEALSNFALERLVVDAVAILAERASFRSLPVVQTREQDAEETYSESSGSSLVIESWAVVVCRLLRIPLYREDDLSGSD